MDNISTPETYIYKQGNQYAFLSLVVPNLEAVVCVVGLNHYLIMDQLMDYLQPNGWFEGQEVEDTVNFYLKHGTPENTPDELQQLLKDNNIH